MSSSQLSENCLKAGQKALIKHDYRAAHEVAMKRLHQDQTDPAPFYLLAHLAADHNNTAKAEELYERAAKLAPNSARYVSAYAKILSLRGFQTQAREQNENAACMIVTDAHVADTIGVVYSRTGLHEAAVPFFEKAIKLNPAPANFYYNLASSLQFLGDFESAEKAYRETILRDPTHVKSYSSLVGLKKQTTDSNELNSLFPLFDNQKKSSEDALHIGHAIAKTLEDLGQYEASLAWLKKAKANKKESLAYTPQNYLECFSAAQYNIKARTHKTDPSIESPIFIVGLPRTGTTLVDRIISSHPDVKSCGELNVIAQLIKTASQTPSPLVLDQATLLAARELDLPKLGHAYWTETSPLRQNASRMTDKMPLNFFYAGMIHKAFPNARIIALRRGAMDSCLSNYRQLFSTSFSYYDYTFDLQDIAQFYIKFDQLMTFWRKILPADRFTEVKYEEIVYDQENQTRRILDFCGLAWDDQCLRFHENTAAVSTASSVQVRQPLYTGSIGRWKMYGNKLDELKIALGSLAE